MEPLSASGAYAGSGRGSAESSCPSPEHLPASATAWPKKVVVTSLPVRTYLQVLGASEVDNAAVFDISQKKNSRGILQCMASAALALGLERRRAPVSTVLWFWVFACALTGQTDVTTLTDVLSYSLLQK